jgi:hypothetical protein
MPITLPQRRPAGTSRKVIIAIGTAYTAAMLLLLGIALGPLVKLSLPGAERVTSGIAPADQSGKPLPR